MERLNVLSSVLGLTPFQRQMSMRKLRLRYLYPSLPCEIVDGVTATRRQEGIEPGLDTHTGLDLYAVNRIRCSYQWHKSAGISNKKSFDAGLHRTAESNVNCACQGFTDPIPVPASDRSTKLARYL
jgi:hypothetical protein